MCSPNWWIARCSTEAGKTGKTEVGCQATEGRCRMILVMILNRVMPISIYNIIRVHHHVIARNEANSMLYRADRMVANLHGRPAYVEIASFLAMTLIYK